MVKAARKAHGESTDVGTEEDLWGPLKDSEERLADAAAPRVTMSMPTHLEIGLLPTSTVPPDQGQCVVGVATTPTWRLGFSPIPAYTFHEIFVGVVA